MEVTPEKPKYVFPKGFQKSREVFGAWQLKDKAQLRTCFLVESPFAVMAFWQKGFHAVSCFGWSISPEQIAVLAQLARGYQFLPDKDKTKEATQYAGLLSQSCWVRMPNYPADDPEALTAEQIKALA
jgi:DNA primase